MSLDEKPKFEGKVKAAQGNGFFTVDIPINKGSTIVLCRLSGKIRLHNINIVEGDIVDVDLDPYDMAKGIITYRKK